jgi:hypothetical protein
MNFQLINKFEKLFENWKQLFWHLFELKIHLNLKIIYNENNTTIKRSNKTKYF